MSVLRQAMARGLAAAAILAITSIAAGAQGVTGTVTGTVKDAQGGVIPGATVTLISQTRGTTSVPVVTNATGDFVFPNLTADTYTIQIEMSSFRTLRRTGVEVNPGSRIALGTLTIDVGGTAEVVTVTAVTPMIQAASGERSFTISTESVTNLPLQNRSYDALLALAPGVNSQPGNLTPATRLGGGGDGNFMIDGATAMDPGVNRPAARISVEAIAEVKVVTSGYQAEYGRSSGLQVNAVTKSGTNRFHGSLYDVERDDRFNSNSRVNILNGDPKPFQDERDWGFAVGGPIGKPGSNNKLFFYFNLEFNPRTFGNNVNRFRVPTALERAGDFSQTTDNLGNPFPFIKDPLLAGACNATSQVACFRDGGVLGKIPANRLYQSGLNILKWWPLPNLTNIPAGQGYNFEVTEPKIPLLGYQPIIRIDYQPFQSLRGSFKFLEYQQPNDVIPGTIPGFNDTTQDDYGIWVPAANVNWTINSKTFVEGSWGSNYHHQEGCSITGGEPNFCRNGLPVGETANRVTAGFGSIPYLFPDAPVLEPYTWAYQVMQRTRLPIWDGTRLVSAPSFAWGSRIANAPPNNQSPTNFILDTRVWNINASVTRVQGSHTIKTGYYHFKSYQRRGQGAIFGSINFQNDSNNPLDSGFGFANAALGVFSQYSQLSRWGEGAYTAVNQEAYVQDNWKLKHGLTLDYGVRFVHQVPQYDGYQKSSNFLPDQWKASAAPALYIAGCANGVAPCTGTNRQAMNPLTGQFLGPNSSLAIGTIVPNSGSLTNGVFASGQGIADTNYTYPKLKAAPRVGAAWDVTGEQKFIVRGSAGLFFDRPPAQNVYNTVNNPPFSRNVTVRYGQLQDLSSAGLTTEAPSSLTVWQYDEPLPTSTQWNTGVQMMLPFSIALDAAYTGQHSYGFVQATNLNAIDIGTAFLASNQDRTQTSTVPGAASIAALNPDLARHYRGFSSISMQQPINKRTYHSIQLNLNRRLRNGIAFGFADTIGLYDRQTVALRLQHSADGTVRVRDDQAKAQELLGNNNPQAHIMRGNFIWMLPKLTASSGPLRALGYLVNDWSLAGIWTGATPIAYTAGVTYQSNGAPVNLTGSPDYAARIRVTGDPGSGCSSDRLRQFSTAAFAGPLPGSDGLESGNGYLKGCFISKTDLSIARTIRLGGSRNLQVRVDLFNTFNQAGITNRQSTLQLNSPTDQTPRNMPFDAAGNVITGLSLPRGAGFGVATAYQDPRTAQFQLRFQF